MKFITGLTCFSNLLFLLISSTLANPIPKCVGIFYSKSPPDSALYLYDWLIVDPRVFSIKKLKEKFYIKKRAKLIAYLSIGELGRHSPFFKEIKPDWKLGENKIWHTTIMDIRKKGYRNFILNKVIPFIFKKGYEGLMLDTLDSYQKVLKEEEWSSYERAEAELINKIKTKYPQIILIANRPFRIFKYIKSSIDAFLAESLFYGLDSHLNYIKMKPSDTEWLLKKLKEVKSSGIPVIVVDYVEPKKRTLAKQVAKKIKELGFIPWVTDKYLSIEGISTYEPVPRKIMLLYDSETEYDPALSSIHRLVQMPLEWLGFVPELYDVKKKLPDGYLADQYRGIVIWIPELKKPVPFYKWVRKRIKEGLKLFFINGFGFPMENRFLSPLGIKVIQNRAKPLQPIKVIKKASFVGFETEPEIEFTDLLLLPEKGTPLVIAENYLGQRFVPLAFTKWGGYALPGSCIVTVGREDLWTVNPFVLFKTLFKPAFPVPDITTENGRRILTAHIDGDAFFGDADFDTSKTTGEVIMEQIIKKFRIPHTVSVIEGEIAPWGIYPDKSKRLEQVARSIFRLQNVEPASHTYSHPFFWKKRQMLKTEKKEYGNNLPIKGYQFDLKREIIGSVNYINRRLLPSGKKVKVFLWSGDCLPSKEALKLTYQLKIYNVNGGDTSITPQHPFISYVSPMGVNLGDYFQVYAPVLNENVYTNLWHGPYYGYVNVISTFKLTDRPIRLKPISIYYHFYSGQKLASLTALKKVYKWALSQSVIPMFLSEYAQKVLEFRTTAIARCDNFWIIRNSGALRTLRIPKNQVPVISKSKGVIGYKKIGNFRYVHLDNSGDYIICLGKTRPQFLLYDSNAMVRKYEKRHLKILITLKGYLPVDFRIIPHKCKVKITPQAYSLKKESEYIWHCSLKKSKEVTIEAYCKN